MMGVGTREFFQIKIKKKKGWRPNRDEVLLGASGTEFTTAAVVDLKSGRKSQNEVAMNSNLLL